MLEVALHLGLSVLLVQIYPELFLLRSSQGYRLVELCSEAIIYSLQGGLSSNASDSVLS